MEKRSGHWWFITPGDGPFFSIGMNHIESSALRYPTNIHIWRERYGNSQERWIREAVAPDLRRWGFNSIGWTAEWVWDAGDGQHRHSRCFTYLFDPELLSTAAGRQRLTQLATSYYEVAHDAIRRYDRNHLILGDRYEAMAPPAEELLRAAAAYVDVLSFQFFGEQEEICRRFSEWHELTGLPDLLADAAVRGRDIGVPPEEYHYPSQMRALRELPCCVGWHYCGAYIKNRVRKAGFRDEFERTDDLWLVALSESNRETETWVAAVCNLNQERDP